MQEYDEKKKVCDPIAVLLYCSCDLTNDTIINQLLLLCLELGLVCAKIYRCVEHTRLKCFNNFVKSAVNARPQGDKNFNSKVFAKTMMLLPNSSYGYEIMDRRRHSVTR